MGRNPSNPVWIIAQKVALFAISCATGAGSDSYAQGRGNSTRGPQRLEATCQVHENGSPGSARGDSARMDSLDGRPDELNLDDPSTDEFKTKAFATRKELFGAMEQGIEKARKALQGTTEDHLMMP